MTASLPAMSAVDTVIDTAAEITESALSTAGEALADFAGDAAIPAAKWAFGRVLSTYRKQVLIGLLVVGVAGWAFKKFSGSSKKSDVVDDIPNIEDRRAA